VQAQRLVGMGGHQWTSPPLGQNVGADLFVGFLVSGRRTLRRGPLDREIPEEVRVL